MTMLDRMRRHKNWLKWSLGVVCAAFILFYIPAFLRQPSVAGAGDVIAEVQGDDITVAEFRRIYSNQLQAYRNAYGGNFNEQLLRQLGLEQQILQQMVDERAALAEARRLGLRVSDAEVRERILSMPAFQENGRFIGNQRYTQLLRLQRPPMTPGDFEQALRRSLVMDKLRSALTEWLTVSDAEIQAEYRNRNEKVKLQVVTLSADAFRGQVSTTDAELAAQFDASKESYRIGEKRKIKFLVIDEQAMRDRVNVSAQDVERHYNDSIEQYSTPEQVRASHILLKTEGKDVAAVRTQAEEILAKVKGGADFAEMAKKFSEDESNAKAGGDLGFFGRGRMVGEFENAVFAMQPGQVSDLVKTTYGFHIIKLVEKKPASVRSLDEARQQIVDQLKWERAQTQAADLAATLDGDIDDPSDLDRVGKARGLKVQESGFFTREEPIVGLGPAPEAAQAAFALKSGEASEAVRVPAGFAFLTVTGRQDAYIPKLEQVKERVRDDVMKKKAVELARQKASELAAALKSAPDFAAAAKAAGHEAKTTELVPRGSALPDAGVSPAVDRAAFSLPTGGVSDPIVSDSSLVIIKVTERKDIVPSEFEAGKEALRSELVGEKRNRFFSAYMAKAKQRMKIEINRETLKSVLPP